MKQRKILVTNALTYANYAIHIGHMIGYIQPDIWVRFQKMRGHICTYVCGSDCHGTPVMLRAEKEGIDPDVLVTKVQQEQAKDVADFLVTFDNFYTTHSKENEELVTLVYQRLQERGDIKTKTIKQAFDPVKKLFLPDRYVKGTCPRCGAKDQYGDSCEACGATYATTDLKDPKSVISGATPELKTTEHYFFELPHYEEKLKKWIHEGHLQEQTINKLEEWFEHGLKDWDISRDAPYFGFKIPDSQDKYFYVWLDAPFGYFASFKNLCDRRDDLDFDEYLKKDSDTELYHFLGKDIMYFHALFWPATLMGADFRTPTSLSIHGFLTVNGEKMSKSRGTFILARTYLNHLHPEYLRYFFASRLSGNIEDMDLNLEDFRQKVNSDLVGKVVNIASRCAGFIHKYFDDKLSENLFSPELITECQNAKDIIAESYESRDFAKAVREIMALADKANQYIDEKKPWILIKDEATKKQAHDVCTMGINLFHYLMLYLKPILPELSKKSEDFLNIEPMQWTDIEKTLVDHKINPFKPMMQRIEKDQIEAMIEEQKAHG